jgi:uncharacterized FlaG/YvyC family protein
MDPLKPIEGLSKGIEGQASPLAEIARDRYWRQRVQATSAVEAAIETHEVTEKQPEARSEKQSAQSHRTYAEFEINRETREISVRIIEAESGKLLRMIPADELAKEIIKGNLQPNQLRRRAIIV